MSVHQNFHPSPAIVVHDSATIEECVNAMRVHNVGSLLVLAKKDLSLAGIFTERDLLRSFELIDRGGYWEKSIATVMTRNVMTLSIDEIEKAPSILFKRKIRHLPLTAKDADGKEHVVGVLSMRDLFQAYYLNSLKENLEKTGKGETKTKIESPLFIHTADTVLLDFLKKAVAKPSGYQSQPVALQDFGTLNGDCLILDLDSVHQKQWTRWLKILNNRKNAPITVLLFNPSLYSNSTKEILEQIGNSERFFTFQKPVSIAGLIYYVSQAGRFKKLMKNTTPHGI